MLLAPAADNMMPHSYSALSNLVCL